MWSLAGDLVCVSNLEHPLPYRWRIQADNDSKRKTKLLNSLRIINEIKKRFPNFKEEDHSVFFKNGQPKKDQQVVTFGKLLHEVELQNKNINKSNAISLKQMELRKSRRINAAGTSDAYINSKKNKNLNNTKLFEKISGTQSSAQKMQESQKVTDKSGSGQNVNIIEKVEIMLQREAKELDCQEILSKKFDDDYKKVKRNGSQIIANLDPQYATFGVPKLSGGARQGLLRPQNEKNSKVNFNESPPKQQMAGSKSLKDLTTTMNFTRSSLQSIVEEDKEDTDWLKYAAQREESLPSILKSTEIKSYLSHIPQTQKNDSFHVPNIQKREQQKARNSLLQELSIMKKHSMSHFQSAQKNHTITTESENDQLGIPIFQQKLGNTTSKNKSKSSIFSPQRGDLHRSGNKSSLDGSTRLPSLSGKNKW